MVDVVIAGGGIAGSALAILLGRAGRKVELFDRAQFPREKTCGEGLMPAGVAMLARMGLAEAAGGAAFHGVRYHFGEETAEGRFPATAGVPAAGRGLRRKYFDKLLLDEAARTAGVAVYTGARVEDPIVEQGRVNGLQVGGKARRARLTVAADGAHSRIRHALGLDVPPRRKRVGMRAHFRLAPGQKQISWVDVFVRRGYELYVTPLPENELLVAGLAYAEAIQAPLERAYESWWRGEPGLAARLKGAEQITSLAAISPLASGARRGFAPGLVLLGDAAGFIDPITGGGMTQALMTAELLAGYVEVHSLGEQRWLASFERERTAMLRDYVWLTRMVLWLSDHPLLGERVLSALKTMPGVFSHLIGVSGGVRRLFPRLGEPNAIPGTPAKAGTPRNEVTQKVDDGLTV